jgi:hypothetical protein
MNNVMSTQKNSIPGVINTAILPGEDSKYASAEQTKSHIAPNTSTPSSNVFAVASSKTQGSITIRTIPTTVQRTVDDGLTT